jgi:hypothetical protein
MTPLTAQEEAVRRMLIDKRLSFEAHHVVELSPAVRMSVDFLVLSGSVWILECTQCLKRKGSAVSEVRRRSAFMDYRFGLLKARYPKILCGALVEAPSEDQMMLGEVMIITLPRANIRARSVEELAEGLSG